MFSRPDAVQSPASASRFCRLTEKPKIGWDILRSFTLFTHGGYDNDPDLTPPKRPANMSVALLSTPVSLPAVARPRVARERGLIRCSAKKEGELRCRFFPPRLIRPLEKLPLFANLVRDAPPPAPGIGICPRVWTPRRSRSSSDHMIRTFCASPLEYHP